MSCCLNISVKRIGEIMSFATEKRGKNLSFSIEGSSPMAFDVKRRDDEFEADVKRVGNVVSFDTLRRGKQLSFNCGLVCSLSDAFYLNVEPEVIWLIPDNDFSQDVVVYSNVTWTIE